MTRRGPFVGRLDHLGVFRSGPDELRHARQWRRIHLRLQRHGLPDGQVVARRGAKRERRDLHARPAGRLMGEFDAQGNTQEEIVWLGDMPLAVVARTGAISSNIGYIFADQINAPRAVVNSQDNSLLWSWFQTDPFGRVEPNNNPQGLGVYDFDMRLPGQAHDNETGLDHNNARDYDPAIGRYIQPDPIGLFNGVNDYSYAHNQSLTNYDSLGLSDLSSFAPGPERDVMMTDYNSLPGQFTFSGHGSPTSIEDDRGPNLPDLTPATLAAEIRANPAWKPGYTKIIRLDSCFTGMTPPEGGLPFAQILANIMGVPVTAPDNFAWPVTKTKMPYRLDTSKNE